MRPASAAAYAHSASSNGQRPARPRAAHRSAGRPAPVFAEHRCSCDPQFLRRRDHLDGMQLNPAGEALAILRIELGQIVAGDPEEAVLRVMDRLMPERPILMRDRADRIEFDDIDLMALRLQGQRDPAMQIGIDEREVIQLPLALRDVPEAGDHSAASRAGSTGRISYSEPSKVWLPTCFKRTSGQMKTVSPSARQRSQKAKSSPK